MDKTLQITFFEGRTNGIKILKFTRGQAIGFSIPKNLFNNDIGQITYLENRITNAGIYFLVGDSIYIGKTGNLFKRFKEHIKKGDKEFTDIVCFTTSDNSLDNTDIIYLEKEIITLASKNGGVELMNGTDGDKNNIRDYRVSDMEDYIEEIKFFMNTLGYKFLEPIKHELSDKTQSTYTLSVGDVKGTMIVNENGYIVLAGSIGTSNDANSLLGGYKKLKQKLISDEIIIVEGEKIRFTKDYIFKSPTAPAQILLGYSVSGPQKWKNPDGITLLEVEKTL